MKYSNRLGVISTAQFQAALDRFDLGQFVCAEAIPFGLFGQNVFVKSTKGEFVFRGAPHFSWQFPTERFFAHQLHEHTAAPVAWPYLFEESSAIFGWSFAIMPRMPGINVMDPKINNGLSSDERIEMAHAMATNLVEMQRLESATTGRFDPANGRIEPFGLAFEVAFPFPPPDDAAPVRTINNAERVEAVIRALVKRSGEYNANTTAADLEWVNEILVQAHDALRVPFTPCFTMEDYHQGNVVFDRSSGRWCVSGVFDLLASHFGDGESDLSRLLAVYIDDDTNLASEYLKTYLRLRTPRDKFDDRLRVYMLLDRLIIWEYLQRSEPQVVGRLGSFRDWADKYVCTLRAFHT